MEIKTKATKEDNEGVWTKFTFEEDPENPVRLKIARAGNVKFMRASDKAEAPHRKKLSQGKVSASIQMDMQCQAMSEGILMDWEGFTEDGKKQDYSPEVGAKVLRFMPELREFVFAYALEFDNYRTEAIQTTAKK